MFDAPEGKGEFLDLLYEEQTERVAGCYVADNRQLPEVTVHLRGWRHREPGSRRTWLFVQVRVDGRLAHELELSKADTAPISLNALLRLYLCAAPSDERTGGEQAEWLCRAVSERLAADRAIFPETYSPASPLPDPSRAT